MATEFEIFIADEIPQRSTLLTLENTGYSGDPRLSSEQKINNAPKGTFFINNADYTLWYKTTKTNPLAWEQILGVGGFYGACRQNVSLLGTYNGVNKHFYLPEHALYDPPIKDIVVYHNGRRLLSMEYEVQESVPGDGWDLIWIKMFAPNTTSKLCADYFVM